MFASHVTPLFKTLSLFHVFLPVLLLWLVYRLGYDARAPPAVRIAFRTGPGITTLCCSALIAASLAVLGVQPADAGSTGADDADTDTDSPRTLDFNEQIHLVFMCEEEKLVRDVYITLGTQYPGAKVFGNIDDSECGTARAVNETCFTDLPASSPYKARCRLPGVVARKDRDIFHQYHLTY